MRNGRQTRRAIEAQLRETEERLGAAIVALMAAERELEELGACIDKAASRCKCNALGLGIAARVSYYSALTLARGAIGGE